MLKGRTPLFCVSLCLYCTRALMTSLDDVIAKLISANNEDIRAKEILAAAITLRDSSGRDRAHKLRSMATSWGVTLNEKIEGKYKPRPTPALAEDIQASVCKAALDWESGAV